MWNFSINEMFKNAKWSPRSHALCVPFWINAWLCTTLYNECDWKAHQCITFLLFLIWNYSCGMLYSLKFQQLSPKVYLIYLHYMSSTERNLDVIRVHIVSDCLVEDLSDDWIHFQRACHLKARSFQLFVSVRQQRLDL